MKNLKSLVVGLLGAGLSQLSLAGIVVDGNIDEWLSNKQTWAVSNAGIHGTVEDQSGGLSTYLNPGYGGQAYDAEALFATILGSKLYIALVTGHNPATVTNPGRNTFGAGDFAIDFGRNGTYEVGINFQNPNGSSVDRFGQLGGVYSVTQWAYGLWDSAGHYPTNNPDPAHPTAILQGALLGQANFSYSSTPSQGYGKILGDDHYFYEMSVDLALLKQAGWNGSAFNIHWTELCANDSIVVDPGNYVPEPGSFALLVGGMMGLFGIRRRSMSVR